MEFLSRELGQAQQEQDRKNRRTVLLSAGIAAVGAFIVALFTASEGSLGHVLVRPVLWWLGVEGL